MVLPLLGRCLDEILFITIVVNRQEPTLWACSRQKVIASHDNPQYGWLNRPLTRIYLKFGCGRKKERGEGWGHIVLSGALDTPGSRMRYLLECVGTVIKTTAARAGMCQSNNFQSMHKALCSIPTLQSRNNKMTEAILIWRFLSKGGKWVWLDGSVF